jgi:DNA-binding response OmpR family regulator
MNKILAIEDDPEVPSLYKSYLQKRGLRRPVRERRWKG